MHFNIMPRRTMVGLWPSESSGESQTRNHQTLDSSSHLRIAPLQCPLVLPSAFWSTVTKMKAVAHYAHHDVAWVHHITWEETQKASISVLQHQSCGSRCLKKLYKITRTELWSEERQTLNESIRLLLVSTCGRELKVNAQERLCIVRATLRT